MRVFSRLWCLMVLEAATNHGVATAFSRLSHQRNWMPVASLPLSRLKRTSALYVNMMDNLLSQGPEEIASKASQTIQTSELKEFVNDGPLGWMKMYLDLLGLKEGKAVFFGPIPVDVDTSKQTSAEEAERRRKRAAEELINISMEERERRDQAGNIMWAVSAVYVTWASLVADDGSWAGLWDVDGNGLAKVDNPETARAILDKVNAMNLENAIKCLVPVGIFAILDKSVSAPFVVLCLICAGLYAMKDKIPSV